MLLEYKGMEPAQHSRCPSRFRQTLVCILPPLLERCVMSIHLSTSLSPSVLTCNGLVLVDFFFFHKIDVTIHKGDSLEVPATL